MPEAAPPQDPPTLPKRRWRRWLFWRLVTLSALYATYCGFLYFYQDSLIFPAYIANARPPAPFPVDDVDVHRLTVSIDDGVVPAWFFPVDPDAPARRQPTVIIFHGNAELAEDMYHFVGRYHRLGLSVALPEYRGYGRAAGEPSQTGITADMIAFHDQLTRRPDVDPQRIVYHGRSIGGGVAAQAAARCHPAAMILQSTFTSLADMSGRYFAPGFLCRHPFHTDEVVADLEMPLLIFHGTEDRIVPIEHGRRLSMIAAHARYIEYVSDHNFFPGQENLEAYWREIGAFLEQAGIITGPATRPAA